MLFRDEILINLKKKEVLFRFDIFYKSNIYIKLKYEVIL